tara:strand:- start:549 stop:992 length:444 start_codon:yes stop_codon:yes gene_type:complete
MKKALLIALAFTLGGFNSLPTFAASQDECAIWICLPTGFPSGCGGAKSAFKDRIKHHKSPLPAFSSCAVQSDSGGSKMSYSQGHAVLIPAQSCGWGQTYSSAPFGGGCQEAPAHWVKDGQCSGMFCQQKSYIDIKVDGKVTGTTYYY